MTFSERQNEILALLKENRTQTVRHLAKQLYVSEATIRRDLEQMQKIGLVERSHGGAFLPESAEEVSIFFRMEKNAAEKERVASKALLHLPAFNSLFIDSSSTALALAERIDLQFKTVVTNNLQTALQLSKKKDVNLLLLGGNVTASSNSTTGSWTAQQLGEFAFDLMLSSCAAVMDGKSFERSLEQKELKRVAFEKSKRRILLVDHTKFENTGVYAVKDLSAYDLVVTDNQPPCPAQENVNWIF